MEERTLTRKDLRRCWRAWMMHNLSSMSFERLESFGFCLSMLPVAKKLYPDAAQRTEMLRRHASFYNTEPQIGAIVNGMALGLEEKKANGEPIDGETINTLKVGLMGPIAGIGDSMIPGMLIPILLSIGMALAAGGNILGPLFYTVAWLAIIIPGSWFLFLKGYKMGSGSVEILVSSKSTRLREALSLLGVFVMGGRRSQLREAWNRDGVYYQRWCEYPCSADAGWHFPAIAAAGRRSRYLVSDGKTRCLTGKSDGFTADTGRAWRRNRSVCRLIAKRRNYRGNAPVFHGWKFCHSPAHLSGREIN
ncbi:PTS system protein [Citrobacter amalonaticus]|nr:PTS system protein [Citrobacter amalonaticus]